MQLCTSGLFCIKNLWDGYVQGSLYDSLRAGFAGCSLVQRLRALVMRELSPQATEGEKMFEFYCNFL